MSTTDAPQTVRLYHLAREWELSPAGLVALLRHGGLEVKSHLTSFERTAIPELAATLARGREAKAEAAAKAKAEAEAAAKAAAAMTEEAAAAAALGPEVEAATPMLKPGAATKRSEKRKKGRRTRSKRVRSERTRRRSLYGSGRLTHSTPVAPPAPRLSESGVAPSVPSFGKPKPIASTAPVEPVEPVAPVAQVEETPAPAAVPTPIEPTPTPAVEPAAVETAPRSSHTALLVVTALVIALAAVLFALSRG